MGNLVDLGRWPLVIASQNGRLTVAEAGRLNAGMLDVLARARAENRRFAVVVDQRERQAPEKGALEIIHTFWSEREAEIAEWCVGYVSVVATPSLADLVENPGPGGLTVLGTVDYDAAVLWAADRLAITEPA
ncbi:hypothetical protein ACIBKY_14225 [Nonomuraea sp. NPDC050394]|uniref:hypothetical protein n=1 Tax=Nonomuraea sp. NPDC050394 TaxID=3364363 RepID=UPI003798FC22